MKPTTLRNWNKLLNSAVIGLFCLVPFYAFISVAVGSALHIYEVWRLWPELLLAVLASAAVWRLYKLPESRQLFQSWLARIALIYCVVLLLAGILTLLRTSIGPEAVLQGMVMDLRLPVALLAGMVLAPGVAKPRLRWLLAPATLVVVFGLLQAFVLPYDSLKHVGYGSATIPAVTLVDQKADYARLQSTLRGPNPLGAYMVIALTAGLVWLARANGRRRVPAGLFVVASLTVLFYSYSRSAYIGFIVAAAVAVWLVLARYRHWLVAGLVVIVVVFVVGLLSLRNNDQVQNVLFHTDETSQSSRSSNQDRASALQSGSRDVVEHPFGGGIGSAGPASVHSAEGGKIAENYYLQVGQETGWLGIALFTALTAISLGTLWKRRAQPFAMVLVASGIGLIMVNMLSHAWTDPTLAYIWWLGTGLAVGSAMLPAETLNQHETKPEKRNRTKTAA